MNNFLIDFLCIGAILSGILVITSKNPVISVLFLICVFVNVAGYLVLLGVGFVGISYIIVYIGAIVVLFLFVIMMLNLELSEINSVNKEYTQNLPLGFIIGSLFIFELINIISNSNSVWQIKIININTVTSILQGIINNINSLFIISRNNINNNTTDIFITFNPINSDTQFSTFTQIQSIGQVLYTNGAMWLIVASVILLLAMVGPIALTVNNSYFNTK